MACSARSRRIPLVRATDAHVSIIAHVTEAELRRYLEETEAANGYGNRHLYFCVRRARWSAIRRRPRRARWAGAGRLRAAVEHGRRAGELRMDSAGRACLGRSLSRALRGARRALRCRDRSRRGARREARAASTRCSIAAQRFDSLTSWPGLPSGDTPRDRLTASSGMPSVIESRTGSSMRSVGARRE